MDNLLQEDATYLTQENQENLKLESYLPNAINNFQFFKGGDGLSFSERIK